MLLRDRLGNVIDHRSELRAVELPPPASRRRWIGPFVFSAVLAAFRIAGTTHEAFQAAAHIWVGMLLALWITDGERPAKVLVITLSVIELACFIRDHFHGL